MRRCVRFSLLVLGLFSCLFLIAELVRSFDHRARGASPTRPPAAEALFHPSHASTASSHPPPTHPSTHFAPPTVHSIPATSLPNSSTAAPLPHNAFAVMADDSDDSTDPSPGSAAPPSQPPSSTALSSPHTESHTNPTTVFTTLTPTTISSSPSYHPHHYWPSTRWTHRRSHFHSPSRTPCPISDQFNITARLTQTSQVTSDTTAPTTGHHHHFTVVLTSHTLHLDWVHLHLAVNRSDADVTSEGTFHMTRAEQPTVQGSGDVGRMGRGGRVWEHRVEGGLRGTEEVEMAFTFHVNRTTCDTQARTTPLHPLLTTAQLLTPSDITASTLEAAADDPVAYLDAEATAADSHRQMHRENIRRDVEAVVGEVVDSALTSVLPAEPQRVSMAVDALGRALPAYSQLPTYAPEPHPYHQHRAYAHQAGFDPTAAYGVGTGVMGFAGGVETRGVDGCPVGDYRCQVTAMCQACFSYELPALCSPCAAILQCQDRLCAHQAVSLPSHAASSTRNRASLTVRRTLSDVHLCCVGVSDLLSVRPPQRGCAGRCVQRPLLRPGVGATLSAHRRRGDERGCQAGDGTMSAAAKQNEAVELLSPLCMTYGDEAS